MVSLDAFLSRLLPSVNGVSDPLAKQCLLDAAIEFCSRSQAVCITSEPQGVTAGIAEYDLDTPAQTSVVATQKAWYGATLLAPASAHEIDAVLVYASAVGADSPLRGTPRCFFETSPGAIGLYPVPDSSAALMLTARVAVQPLRDATSVPDELYTVWVEDVIAGARARLYGMSGQYFSSPALALETALVFRVGINRARTDALRGRVNTSLRVRPMAF